MLNSIPELVEQKVKIFKNRNLIFEDKNKINYSELYFLSKRVSDKLLQFNLKKGDKVCVCMSKSIDQILIILGCLGANLVFVPILPFLKKDSINYIIKNSEAKIIITDKKRNFEIETKHSKKLVYFENRTFTKTKRLDQKVVNKNKKIKIKKNDIAAIIYSSGSTGMPKGIVIPHINFVKGAHIVSNYLRTKSSDKILGVLSFNFDYGLNQLWQCLLLGCSLFLHNFTFPIDFFNFVKTKKISVLPLMPVIMSIIFQKKIPAVFKHVRYICTSGGPVEKDIILKLKRNFPKSKIILMYGLTEAFRSTFLEPNKVLKKYNSIGKAIPNVKIHILNTKLQDCKVGEVGELVHRGGCISKGYYRDLKNTKKVFKNIKRFPGEKVVFSGDLVKKDKEGDIFFIGRKDHMIKTAGYRVSPTEVENQIMKIKNIKFVVVTSKYDFIKGQKIICAYTTKNKRRISDRFFTKCCQDYLPTYMIPAKKYFFKNFPITGNQGKINRSEVINKIKIKND